MIVKVMVMVMMIAINAADTNEVFDPCSDAMVQKFDGFTFGLAFSDKDSFFSNQVQLSPCDSRLALSQKAQLAVFRPQVDEISLLTINSSPSGPVCNKGYMVAFAGRKHAARSFPVMISDNNTIITSFTLVNSVSLLVAFPPCYFLRCNSIIDIRKVLCLRSLNSRRVLFKTCIGRNLDANHAPWTLFASMVKTVHYQCQSVRVTEVLMIVI
ncbi:hypothetical protein NC652_012338 [Populus alba x Populus x berolinensis]|nr:hypothetical protein NC652_012338 [Populus alba x Populus x berolinensis]